MSDARSHLRLGARIGRGGMAEVFAGRLVGKAGFEKDVAVKRVLPRYAGDPSFLSRFLDEARLAARLSHPNIVQIFELGQEGEDHYIVMEAVRGVNLGACLTALAERDEKMPVAIAVHVAESLCAGLAYAHELCGAEGAPLGLVHRDISPHNVLLGFEGAVKLIDFGIARARDSHSVTQAGHVVGKVQFMAPEQLMGQPVDERADIFALGAVLYEMLSGVRPFEGLTEQIVLAVTEGRRARIDDLEPTLDADVVDAVERAMAHEARDRFPTARAFGAALLAAVHGRTRVGAHDVEAMLARLFPDAAKKPWPVESTRADHAEQTQTVNAPVRDVTLDVTLVGGDVTLDARRPRRRAAIPIAAVVALGIAVAAAVVAVFVARLPGSSDVAAHAADAGAVAGAVDAGAVPVAVTVAGAVDAGVVVDAADAAAAVGLDFGVDAGDASVKHGKRAHTGRLVVETKPWSEVRVGGRLLGITPLSFSLPVGEHALRLTNPDLKLVKTVTVVVSEDKAAVVRVDLRH